MLDALSFPLSLAACSLHQWLLPLTSSKGNEDEDTHMAFRSFQTALIIYLIRQYSTVGYGRILYIGLSKTHGNTRGFVYMDIYVFDSLSCTWDSHTPAGSLPRHGSFFRTLWRGGSRRSVPLFSLTRREERRVDGILWKES